MSKASTLRLRDIRNVYRLIGDCRDLGGHPSLWYRQMLTGLYVLFGVLQAAGGEGWWHRPDHAVEPISVFSVSGEPAADVALHAYHRTGIHRDPIMLAIQALPGRLITRTRRELVPDDAWYGSPSAGYRRMGGIDHVLTSVREGFDGAISGIALNRAIGDRDFTARERRLVEFFHAEIGRLIGGALVSATEPGVEHLSPRLRETLACLLEGDSEKQVAARLGLSQLTVHQYVTELYRRFRVRSRAQLLAHVLRRLPGPEQLAADTTSHPGRRRNRRPV